MADSPEPNANANDALACQPRLVSDMTVELLPSLEQHHVQLAVLK